MSVYLIHLKVRFKHARHYIGFAEHLEARIKHHRNGTGAHFLKVVNQANIDWEVARIWEGKDRTFERSLKNKRNSKAYCPICRKLRRERAKKSLT